MFPPVFLPKSIQHFFTQAEYCSINRRLSPGFGEPEITLSEGSQLFFQLNWHAWKHRIPTSKRSRVLHLLVGIGLSIFPRWTQYLWFAYSLLPALQDSCRDLKHRQNTCSGSALGSCRGGSHGSLWSWTRQGAGADKRAVLHEQFTMRWISLQHCWEAWDVCRGGNSLPHWRGMTDSSCTGSLAPVPPGPAALRECREAWCHLVSGWGQQWVPGHRRAQSALLSQRNRRSI